MGGNLCLIINGLCNVIVFPSIYFATLTMRFHCRTRGTRLRRSSMNEKYSFLILNTKKCNGEQWWPACIKTRVDSGLCVIIVWLYICHVNVQVCSQNWKSELVKIVFQVLRTWDVHCISGPDSFDIVLHLLCASLIFFVLFELRSLSLSIRPPFFQTSFQDSWIISCTDRGATKCSIFLSCTIIYYVDFWHPTAEMSTSVMKISFPFDEVQEYCLTSLFERKIQIQIRIKPTIK